LERLTTCGTGLEVRRQGAREAHSAAWATGSGHLTLSH
jgi:hypothetical protein